MVRLAGFEPAAYGLEVRCSIQLSYRRIVEPACNIISSFACLCFLAFYLMMSILKQINTI